MADGSIALRAQIAKLQELGNITTTATPTVAKAVKDEVVKQVNQGLGPDGKPWKETKAGTPPLQGAGRAVKVSAVGTVILLRLDGRHARHHLGAVKGGVKREQIPTGKIPDPVTRAITKVLTGEFRQIMGDE